MTAPAIHEVPVDRQLVDAQAAVDHASELLTQAREAEAAASDAYDQARRSEPAAQTTDNARHAWAEAWRDFVDAAVDLERARDELHALHRQTATYAVMEEADRG